MTRQTTALRLGALLKWTGNSTDGSLLKGTAVSRRHPQSKGSTYHYCLLGELPRAFQLCRGELRFPRLAACEGRFGSGAGMGIKT